MRGRLSDMTRPRGSPSWHFLWALCLLAGLTACAVPASPAAPTESGVSPSGILLGTVRAGPTCPVEPLGSPCRPLPVEGAHVELLTGPDVVADTLTSAAGEFRLTAPPGSYVLRATSPGSYRSQVSQPVELTEGGASRVNLLLDTGIR